MSENQLILTPLSVWSDFNPQLPLKESVIDEMNFDGKSYKQIYFSGREVGDERVRISALYVKNILDVEDKAILLIHHLDEEINYDIVNYYLSWGYSVLVADIKGERKDVANYTKYPSSIAYANVEMSGRYRNFVDSNAKETSWYEWVAVERYAITYLKDVCKIDKIGVVGIKDGANIAWQLIATDNRINCASMLFGGGWKAYKDYPKCKNKDIVMDNERRRFLAGVDAHAYAMYCKCPILFQTSTNGSFFDCDRAVDTIIRVNENVQTMFNYAPNLKESLDSDCENNIKLFFNKYLKNQDVKIYPRPELAVSINNINLTANILVKDKDDIEYIKLYVSECDRLPESRSWAERVISHDEIANIVSNTEKIKDQDLDISTDIKIDIASGENNHVNGDEQALDKDLFTISLNYELSLATDKVHAFVKIKYKNGVAVSSNIVEVQLESKCLVPSNVLYSSRKGLDNITFNDNKNVGKTNDFVDKDKSIKLLQGGGGIYGAYSQYGLIIYRIADDLKVLNSQKLIKFDIYLKEYCQLKLSLVLKDKSSIKRYSLTTAFKAMDIWQNKLIELSDFKTEFGMPVKNFDEVDSLEISSDSNFIINNIVLL